MRRQQRRAFVDDCPECRLDVVQPARHADVL
jgi:hypothetical protein